MRIKSKKIPVVCSRYSQNLKFVDFTLLFCRLRQKEKERTEMRAARVARLVFPSLTNDTCFVALSLLKLSNEEAILDLMEQDF